MEEYLILDNKTVNNNNQWIFYIDEEKHIVTLKEDGNLYVDREFVKQINMKYHFNYEYRFKIGDKECSIVKLTKDKYYRLAVDGRYLSIKKEYTPLSQLLYATYVFIAFEFLSFLAFAVLFLKSEKESLLNMVYAIAAVVIFMLVLKCFEYLANCPCKIQNDKLNKLFRFFLMILAEGLYIGGVITILSFIV